MSMNETPSGERLHIGIFGRRNAGKSSLINAITGQDLAIVSEVKGTTTDPVKKAMELLPLGPVVLIDTPGLDDEGGLGQKRMEKGLQMLRQTDVLLLVIAADTMVGDLEQDLLAEAKKRGLPYLIVLNKTDLLADPAQIDEKAGEISQALAVDPAKVCPVSTDPAQGIGELKERLAKLQPKEVERPLIRDLLEEGDLVVLVVPIDSAAPKGRLILPQQQVIRDLLDIGAMPFVCRESELSETFAKLKEAPALVITDSQVFPLVDWLTPPQVRLTSFSILFARYKGDLKQAAEGAKALEMIQDGDPILISEGCTHHRQCGDIGTEKLPDWIRQYTGKAPEFHFTSGTEFPEDVSGYKLIVHCGGCMLNAREMKSRLRSAADQEIPMTNYGILIAYMKGILKRSMGALEPVR